MVLPWSAACLVKVMLMVRGALLFVTYFITGGRFLLCSPCPTLLESSFWLVNAVHLRATLGAKRLFLCPFVCQPCGNPAVRSYSHPFIKCCSCLLFPDSLHLFFFFVFHRQGSLPTRSPHRVSTSPVATWSARGPIRASVLTCTT